MGHKILSQGVLDGACFLYSIMNAYKTIVYPELDIFDFKDLKPIEKSGKQKWEYLIRLCPQTNDMFAGLGFYNYIEKMAVPDPGRIIESQFNNFIQTAFKILSDIDNEFLVSNIPLTAIDTFDFTDSVVILPFVERIKALAGNEIGDHFICINGRTGDKMHVVCSYTIHCISNYNEMFDNKFRRYYNNMIKTENINAQTIGKGINLIYKVQRLGSEN